MRAGLTPAVPLLLLALAAVPAAQLPARAAAALADGPTSLVRVDLERTPGLTLNDLQAAGFDVAYRRGESLDLVCRPADLARLSARGVPYDVVHADLQAFYEARLTGDFTAAPPVPLGEVALSPPFGQGSMGGYYTWVEVVAILDQLSAQFPHILSPKFSLGQTIEGRDIWAVKLSDNHELDEDEPEVRFDAMHHSREPESMQTLIWTLAWMLDNYGTDPLANYLINERETWFIPVVNPDGYVHNQTQNPGGGGLWRKNRRDNGDGTFGVDLNRNYSHEWGFDDTGSSPSTGSETYRGPSPASEPETAAMIAFISSRDFETALSCHTYSNLWLYPWGYTFTPSPDESDIVEISDLATEENGYLVIPGSGLYLANGITVDYDYGVHGTFCWTPEIGGDADGFWPPTSRIVPLAEENRLALLRTALAAGSYVHSPSSTLIDAGDGDGFPEAGETVELVLDLRNVGRAATGAPVQLELRTQSPLATVTQATASVAAMGSFTSADNAAQPLALSVDGGATPGSVIPVTVVITFDGLEQKHHDRLFVGERTNVLFDDLEVASGWTEGVGSDTATTGLWERGDPIGTTSGGDPVAPEDDATPDPGTMCYVTGNGGGGAGTDDVDNGKTTLISPAIDLSGVPAALIEYARWFADFSTADDVFEVSVSDDDGGSWTTVESVATTENEWKRVSFLLNDYVTPTATVRLRFVASDDPNNSLVEAAVDDLCVEAFGPSTFLGLSGPMEAGGELRLQVNGDPGDSFVLFGRLEAADPAGADGADGTVGRPVRLASGVLGPAGRSTLALELPSDLAGRTVTLRAALRGDGLVLSAPRRVLVR